jgi:two-component system sensor histidine kinase DesK
MPVARAAGIFSLFISLPAVIGLVGDEPSTGRVIAVVAAVVVFMATVVYAIRGRLVSKSLPTVLQALALCAAIAITLTIADRSDWSLLFYYVLALGGIRLPRPSNVVSVVAVAAIGSASAKIGGATSDSVWGLGLSLLGIGAAMLSLGELMRANRELIEARAEVARLAVADERTRFARDLHDLLGHSLSVIALKTQLARRRLPDDPRAALNEVVDIESITREALQEVRQAVSGYRRPVLDAELAGARTALDAAGIETTIDRPAVDLPNDVEAVLAWTVREAATNVIRHSRARHSAIRLVPALDHASLEVLDDGVGAGNGNSGSGLAGLEERLRAAGGRLEAGPRDDGPGFRVRAVVPVGTPE